MEATGEVSRSAWTITFQCTQTTMHLMSGMMSKRTSVDATGKVCTFDIVSMVFVLILSKLIGRSLRPPSGDKARCRGTAFQSYLATRLPLRYRERNLLSDSFRARASRRLSRTIHIPMPSGSGQSSRSNSCSRSSSLSGLNGHFEHALSTGPNRRSSRILVDDPVGPIMSTLFSL